MLVARHKALLIRGAPPDDSGTIAFFYYPLLN
jgi:hypothetical protein